MVCSEHFSPRDYVYDPSLRQSLGCHQRPALSRSAVPSIALLTRRELASLQQEILDEARDAGASILGIDSNMHIEENVDVLPPLVVSLVEGKPSPLWHQADELIRADSCILPSEATRADLREHTRPSPLDNSNESISSATSASPEHTELSPLDMLDVTLVEGQPLSLQLKTKTDDCYLSTGRTLAFSANTEEKDMQALFPPNHWRRTSKTNHQGIGHNKMVQVTIRGKSIGTQLCTSEEERTNSANVTPEQWEVRHIQLGCGTSQMIQIDLQVSLLDARLARGLQHESELPADTTMRYQVSLP
ncbi:hypothetical protein MTO96_024277 [Rhipicephalus appendiculatus]